MVKMFIITYKQTGFMEIILFQQRKPDRDTQTVLVPSTSSVSPSEFATSHDSSFELPVGQTRLFQTR